jgi:hypothetical protein
MLPQLSHLPAAILLIILTLLPQAPVVPLPPYRSPASAVSEQRPAMLAAHVVDLDQAAMWDHYRISVNLNPEQAQVRGQMRVSVTNRTRSAYERLYFRLYPNHPDYGGRLDVTSARVADQPVASGTEQRDSLIWLSLPEPLVPGATAVAQLSFVAQTPRNASESSFGVFNQEAGLWSLAGLYPVLARSTPGQGWDRRPVSSRGDFTVTSTALYDVTIELPQDWRSITTGVLVESGPGSTEGLRRERFVSGPQREFYLGATYGLEQVSGLVDGVRIVSHYQSGDATAGRRALRIAEQALRLFNARFGPYPLAELEIVQGAMTNFFGMEYPGVVLIEQQLYRRDGRDLETTIVHEIAHQWWYSLVGNDAQGEPWLDEGLASYAQVLYYEALGNPVVTRAELENFRAAYRRIRERRIDAPLATPPSRLRASNYVPVVYAKGALFFHALRGRIGEAAFTQFLQDYYRSARYRDIAGTDLLFAAEQACSCSLDQFYRDWVLTAAAVKIP